MAKNKYDVDEVLTKEFHKGHLKELLKYILPYKKSLFMSFYYIIIRLYVQTNIKMKIENVV